MAQAAVNALSAYNWECQPAAEQLVKSLVADFLTRCPDAAKLADRMKAQTGTRFGDWVDYIALPASADVAAIESAGYARKARRGRETWYTQEKGMFPMLVIRDGAATEIALKVEFVADFAAVHRAQGKIEGAPLDLYRRLAVCDCDDTCLSVVERHGCRPWDVPQLDPSAKLARLEHSEALRARRREFGSEETGFEHAGRLVDAAVAELGADVACDLWFAAEREYWMRRNHAARVQKARQDRLGLGWANHDHHTYRSSRHNFARLVRVWEKLGLQCRERFYAGKEAGWGAQVMEQPVTGIITFNDVDLSPEELFQDIAHEPLAERKELGTIGLWTSLHGESFLQAGMHHLEAQFDFDSLRQQLEAEGVKTMKPFTDFPFLRQAFTEGERWKVADERINALLAKGQITEAQARQFRETGALGSHLENLERNEGFKGFNQKGVSEIIRDTDPRLHAGMPTPVGV